MDAKSERQNGERTKNAQLIFNVLAWNLEISIFLMAGAQALDSESP